MDEEKTTKEKEQTDSEDDSTEGIESKTTSELKEREELLDKKEELLDREEALEARRKNAGESEAGKPSEQKKEETDKEYRTRVTKELAQGKTEFGN